MGPILHNEQNIILASGSPRRRAYFEDLGLSFQVVLAEVEEKLGPDESPKAYTRRLALEKAAAVGKKHKEQWIVAADTVVCCDDKIMEKPVDAAEALAMLMLLRNREHQVLTSVCLYQEQGGVAECCSVVTSVSFWDFSEDMARAYVATKEPFDKAGSYGIQGRGAFLVKEVRGSYSNVVGLPLVECISMLVRHKVVAPQVQSVS